jgi:hypothetical protein
MNKSPEYYKQRNRYRYIASIIVVLGVAGLLAMGPLSSFLDSVFSFVETTLQRFIDTLDQV